MSITYIPRYIQSSSLLGKSITRDYIHEEGKITTAKWNLVEILKGKIYVCKLDKRSIRYMKDVMVRENKMPGLRRNK